MTDRPTTWSAPQIWIGRIAILVAFFFLWERAAASKFIDPILIGVVVLSLVPITIHWLRARRGGRHSTKIEA